MVRIRAGQRREAAGQGEFDLTTLPVHIAGQRDGGPVIGSGLVVTKDPDTGRRNVSFHRLQVKGPNKTGILLYPRHSWANYLKYQERGEPMPVAIFIGHYPLYYAAASTTAPYGTDEFEVAGGYLGESVRLVPVRDGAAGSAGRRGASARGPHPAALPRGRGAVLGVPGLST